MASTALILYLTEGEVAAYLELLRRLSQPDSTSRPHLTVRYSSQGLRAHAQPHYLNVEIDDLVLGEPSTFDPVDASGALRTVIISCESENLEWLSYRPDYPNSLFHITVYEGPPSEFARRVLEVLKEFPWNLRINMPFGDLDTVLRSRSRPSSSNAMSNLAQSLFDQLIANAGYGPAATLTDVQRLNLIGEVCRRLHASTEVSPADVFPFNNDRYLIDGSEGQASFWSEREISELSPAQSRTDEPADSATYLTPPELAYDLVKGALEYHDPDVGIDFGDPALGPGIFFAALRRLIDSATLRSAVGVERDPARASRTSFRWRRAGLQVIEGDFLRQSGLAPRNFVAANPPYVRFQKLHPSIARIRSNLQSRIGIQLDGRSDIYVYFVLAAHSWMQEEGIAVWLLPSEFLVADYGRALREYLSSKVQLLRIHVYDSGSPLFDNARISSAAVVFRRSEPARLSEVQLSRSGTLLEPTETQRLTVGALASAERWNWSSLFDPEVEGDYMTLGDLFLIKRGIATGANGLFLLSDAQVEELKVDRRWIRPVLPKSRSLQSNVIGRRADGSADVTPGLWVIDTNEDLGTIRRDSPEFADYLVRIQEEVGQRTLIRERPNIYKQENRQSPLFAFVYMAKVDAPPGRRFILNRSDAIVVNSYLGLNPRPNLAAWLTGERRLKTLHSILSNIPNSELERNGRGYVSGLLKLEPSDLARVRIQRFDLS
ncbi:MAG TPA: Eco57I restriction-modification methylase domain-containing protein [Steroidobacteraceae bacterium]